MSRVELEIFYKVGNVSKKRCTVNKWKFHDAMMGEQYLTFSISSTTPIDWAVGDYCIFRGETYTLNYVPSVTQKAGTKEHLDAYVYENVKLNSFQEELTRCLMLDITATTEDYISAFGTNYIGSSKFSLFCGETSVNDKTFTAVCALVAKMEANLARMYPTNGWKIFVSIPNTHTEDKLLTFDNTTVAEALQEVHNTFDLDYCVRGHSIYIGYNLANLTGTDDVIENPEHADNEVFSFGYGKGYPTHEDMNKGLFEIKRIANSQQQIVTRLRAYGSTKNMPYRYYNRIYNLSQSLFPTNLQLPDTFSSPSVKNENNSLRDPSLRKVKGDTNDSYIDKNDDAEHCAEGIREYSARWDGTDSNLPEIYPTIEGATYGELRNALVEDQDGKRGGNGGSSDSAFYPYGNDERIDKLLAVGYYNDGSLVDDANKGSGVLPESGISVKGVPRNVGIGSTYLYYNTQDRGDFANWGNKYAGAERTLFSIQGVSPGKYAMAPTNGQVFYGFSLSCHRDGCSCDVGYQLTVKAKNTQSGVTSTIATYESEYQKVMRSSGVKEVPLPSLPDVESLSPQVPEINVSALSDITVCFRPIIKNVEVPSDFTDNFSVCYRIGSSQLENAVTYEPEYTWIPVVDSDTLTDQFHVFVQDMGFDIQACWTDETPVVAMKSGRCVGREFEILNDVQKVRYDGKKGYMLTLKRATDSSLNTYYPSASFPISAGDQFVLLNVSMPDTYVKMAEVRLLRAATDYLADNCETQFTYQPSIDDIYLQRNLDNCRAAGREQESILWRLYAGLKFTFRGVPASEDSPAPLADITIEKVTISMGESLTPKVELTLNDDVQQSTIQKLTTSVDRIYNGSIFSGGNVSGASAAMSAALLSILQSEGNKLFLSKTNDDVADGKITFNDVVTHNEKLKARKGLIVGNFQSRLLGSGALIDEEGNAEFESIYSRNFISTPEFRFNRISVTDGENWCTNGFGTIKNVEIVNETTGYIDLKLEANDHANIAVEDICRGIYNDVAGMYETAELDDDSVLYAGNNEGDGYGFSCKDGFFTSYFWVKQIIKNKSGECRFLYELRNASTPHPCAFMKFAQYGNFDKNSGRCSSSYSTSIGHYYEMVLDGVTTWKIKSANIVYRKGYLGNMNVTIKLKDADGNYTGETKDVTLNGYGLYVQDHVYFGNAIVQLNPETLSDILNQLRTYEIDLSGYVDVITVDDTGNVIGGLYTLSGENNEYKNYRINSSITVRKNGKLLTIASDDSDAGPGTYKIYLSPRGCTCTLENSTLYITSIDNVKDGISGSSDDTDFDYDAMRLMDSCCVDLIIDCEGLGSIQKKFPVTIKHDSEPYISADITNEFSSVSWNTAIQRFVGLPLEFDMKMWRNNIPIDVHSISVNGVDGATSEQRSMQIDVDGIPLETSLVSDSNDTLIAHFRIMSLPDGVSVVKNLNITASTIYAGVAYERTLVHTINKFTDTNVYSLLPSQNEIVLDANTGTLNEDEITCAVVCDSSDDKHYTVLYDSYAVHGIALYYKKFYTDGTSDADETLYNGTSISISPTVSKVVFYLYGLTNGIVNRSILHDTESVPVLSSGKDGLAYTVDAVPESVTILADETTATYSGVINFYKIIGDTKTSVEWYSRIFVRKLDGTRRFVAGGHTFPGYGSIENPITIEVTSDDDVIEIFCIDETNRSNILTDYIIKKEIPIRKHGDTGSDAVTYYLTASPTTITRTHLGSYKGAARPLITGWKKIGDNDPIQLSEIEAEDGTVGDGFTIVAKEMNGDDVVATNTSSTGTLRCEQPSSSSDRFDVALVRESKTYATLPIPIITEVKGSDGSDGVYPRDRGYYKEGETYIYQKVGDMYVRDKVVYEIDGIMYAFLVKTKGSTVTTAPNADSVAGTDENWEMGSIVETVIANTMFGTNANIGGFMVSNEKMVSTSVVYQIEYWGDWGTREYWSFDLHAENGIWQRPMAQVDGKYYVQKNKTSHVTYNSKYQLKAAWRLATDYELAVLKSTRTIQRANEEHKIIDIFAFVLDGSERFIGFRNEDDTYWSVDGKGTQEIGSIYGKHVRFAPSTQGIEFYNEQNELSLIADGSTQSTIDGIFSDSTGSISLEDGQRSMEINEWKGDGLKWYNYEDLSSSTFEIKPNSIVDIEGSTTLSANRQVYRGERNSYPKWDSSDGQYYLYNCCYVHVLIYVYSDASCTNLIKSFWTGKEYQVWLNNTETFAIKESVNVGRFGDYTKGYAKLCFYTKIGLNDNNGHSASAQWTGIRATINNNLFMSRLFANGFSYGSSAKNFIAAVQESGGLHVKALTGNGSCGLELAADGVYMFLGGTRYKLSIDNGTAKLTES